MEILVYYMNTDKSDQFTFKNCKNAINQMEKSNKSFWSLKLLIQEKA